MKDDFDPLYHWRTVQARVLAQRGEFAEAEVLVREAVEIVGQTDWYHQRGQASSALGEVLQLAGRTDEARAAYEQARAYYERKQARPELEEIRTRLDALGD